MCRHGARFFLLSFSFMRLLLPLKPIARRKKKLKITAVNFTLRDLF